MSPRVPLPWRSGRRRAARDVEDEILGHIELKVRDLERRGLDPDEARAAAEAAFGRTDAVAAECRAIQNEILHRSMRTMNWDEVRGDLRWAARSLRRAPGFTAFASLTLAFGVAANTSIFSIANGLFFRSLPGIRDPGTLVEVSRGPGFVSVSHPVYEQLRDRAPGLRDLAAFDLVGLSLGAGDEAARVVLGLQVSGNYFDVLGTRPAVGRFFAAAERDPAARPAVAVISHDLWRDLFREDRSVVGSTVRLNGEPVTVVGVAEEGFVGHVAPARADVFMPLGAPLPGFHQPASLAGVSNGMLELVGRVEAGTDLEALAVTLGELARARIAAEGLETTGYVAEARPYAPVPGSVRGPAALFFTALSVMVGLLLLITCLNVAGLLLSRSEQRRREIAIRLSLGAGRRRLVRQLVSESLLLATVAGALGIVLTFWVTGVLSGFQLPVAPIPGLRLDLQLRPDAGVLAYSLALAAATGLVFGLLPALRSTRPDLVTDLKEGARPGTRGRSRLQAVLVGAQMAGTIVLLTGSGLFLRAVVSAEAVDPGFDAENVWATSFDLELAGRSPADSHAFYDELARRARDLPGVVEASVAGKLPLAGLSTMAPVRFEGVEPPPGQPGHALANQSVGPGYFRTLGIPLLRGRDFGDVDDAEGAPVVIVNEFLAERMWRGGSGLGRTVTIPSFDGDDVPFEVVGVVGDARYSRLDEEPRPFAYFPAAQRPRTDMILHVKTVPGAPPPIREIRALAASIEPAAAALSTGSVASAVAVFLLPQRIGAWVTGVIGLFGLLLGCLGIYGLTAYWVASHGREVGIRLALGASGRDVLADVLRRGSRGPLVGGLVGLAGALLTSRFLEAFLFGVDPLDPATFAGVAGTLLAASAVANLAPALRAARLDPARVLREE